MRTKTIFIFGNPELEMDSLPLRIAPGLRRAFPAIDFEINDPNEEWDDFSEEMVMIDTAVGPKEVTVFDDLDSFDASPRLTMHDFDALANLKYLKKLGKLKKVTIIGVPPEMSEGKALEDVVKEIRKLGIRG